MNGDGCMRSRGDAPRDGGVRRDCGYGTGRRQRYCRGGGLGGFGGFVARHRYGPARASASAAGTRAERLGGPRAQRARAKAHEQGGARAPRGALVPKSRLPAGGHVWGPGGRRAGGVPRPQDANTPEHARLDAMSARRGLQAQGLLWLSVRTATVLSGAQGPRARVAVFPRANVPLPRVLQAALLRQLSRPPHPLLSRTQRSGRHGPTSVALQTSGGLPQGRHLCLPLLQSPNHVCGAPAAPQCASQR
jgi:hypothetical protein